MAGLFAAGLWPEKRRVNIYDLAIGIGGEDVWEATVLIGPGQVNGVEVHAAAVIEMHAADIIGMNKLQSCAAHVRGLGLKRRLGCAIGELVSLIIGAVGIPHHVGIVILLAFDVGFDCRGWWKRL